MICAIRATEVQLVSVVMPDIVDFPSDYDCLQMPKPPPAANFTELFLPDTTTMYLEPDTVPVKKSGRKPTKGKKSIFNEHQ